MAVPTIYVKLMEEAEKQNLQNIDVSEYRLVISGSAAMPDPVAQRQVRLFHHMIRFSLYHYS